MAEHIDKRRRSSSHRAKGDVVNRTIYIFCCAGVLLAIAACNRAPPRPTAEQLATLQPADARLAGLYINSCKICHAKADSGAPLVHDHQAWDPRWAKGPPTLVDHAIVGFQAMPAGGQCAACNKADYEKLIRFMADQETTP